MMGQRPKSIGKGPPSQRDRATFDHPFSPNLWISPIIPNHFHHRKIPRAPCTLIRTWNPTHKIDPESAQELKVPSHLQTSEGLKWRQTNNTRRYIDLFAWHQLYKQGFSLMALAPSNPESDVRQNEG
ncbi:hypothetical protein LIER_31721 [Lithospermum erythrorhizon]|uniref:Uncharacterized protein n=1 Tax=Lithospermum erythrorhizon TaxID=34254 RepID=A0AAV3RTP2_LITER